VIVLDAADLVVIAARTLGISTEAVLAVMDIPAAQAALAEAQPPGWQPGAVLSGRETAAAAGVGLVHALLRHRPFPRQGRRVAVSAGLQFLSVNGWQADLNPPATAAVVIDALASGQVAAGDAAAWLSQRLSPAPRAHHAPRLRRAGRAPATAPRLVRAPAVRAVAGALATAMVGGVAVLASACSRTPDMSSSTAARPHDSASTSQESKSERTAVLAYASCMRSHGIWKFPEPSLAGVVVSVVPGTGIDQGSPLFRSAEQACQPILSAAGMHIVTAATAPRSHTP
jgi:hypothetical protein